MEILLKVTYFVLLILQGTQAQPNLAALWGLGALGDMGDGPMGGFGGLSNFNGMSGQSTGQSSGSCPYQAHPDKLKFTQMVNNRLMTQSCAPGTMFVLSKCSCDNIPSGGAGAPMPGYNPRLGAGSGGGGNSLLNALVSQLQSAGTNPALPSPPARNQPPPISNHINGVRPRISSGIRPDQSSRNTGVNQQPSPSIQYSPKPSPGVDRSVSPNVLPPELMHLLKGSQTPQRQNNGPAASKPTQGLPRRPSMGSKPTPSAKADMSSLSKSGMPPEVLKMLQRSMGPPTAAKPQPRNQKSQMYSLNKVPSSSSNTRRVPAPTQAARPRTPTMSLPKPTRRSQIKPQPGPRQDPFAALLAGLQPSRSSTPTRTSNSAQRDPLAALMAGLGGGNSMLQTGSRGGNPMAALMAGLEGGSSGSGSNPFAALLGSSSGSGSLSSPGGPLDVTSLTGNVNVAALLGETPGPGLAQNVDMTALFNAQGQMGAGGGIAGLAGLNNINVLKLQQLDRQGIIDISDLTPAGLAAANAHFG